MHKMYIGVIPADAIKPNLDSTTKTAVMEELLDMLVEQGYVTDRERVRQALLDREEQGSTAVGKGVAFPHCKTEGIRQLAAAFGRSAQGVNCGAEDGEPVYLFFLMVAPLGESGPHVRALGRLAKLVADDRCRSRLLQADTVEKVVQTFAEVAPLEP